MLSLCRWLRLCGILPGAWPLRADRKCRRAYLFGGKQIVHVFARSGLEKTARFRRAIRLLMTLRNRRRNEPGRTAFQEVLFIQHFHFQRNRKPGGEFDYPMVQEGEAAFHGMGHGHAVALRRQDIAGEQVFRFQVLGLAETVPRCVRLGQPRSDFGITNVSANFRTDGIGEEGLQAWLSTASAECGRRMAADCGPTLMWKNALR